MVLVGGALYLVICGPMLTAGATTAAAEAAVRFCGSGKMMMRGRNEKHLKIEELISWV